jgi:hypothetical protein
LFQRPHQGISFLFPLLPKLCDHIPDLGAAYVTLYRQMNVTHGHGWLAATMRSILAGGYAVYDCLTQRTADRPRSGDRLTLYYATVCECCHPKLSHDLRKNPETRSTVRDGYKSFPASFAKNAQCRPISEPAFLPLDGIRAAYCSGAFVHPGGS